MPKKRSVIFFAICLLFLLTKDVFAAPCGNGVCQSSQNEDCNSCSIDCGSCPPPPTVTPTPTPTPPPPPTINPTPTVNPTPVATQTAQPTVNPTNPPTAQPTTQPTTNPTGGPTSQPTDSPSNEPETSPTPDQTTPNPDSSSTPTTTSENSSSNPQTITPTPTPTLPPPVINLPNIPINPIDDQTPTISGNIDSQSGIKNIEISFNNGNTWFATQINGNKFSYTPDPLDDGNYLVRIRVTDNLDRTFTSPAKTLIIDLLPPIIGGSLTSLGSIGITPDKNNVINVPKGGKLKYLVSTKGGVTQGTLTINDQLFEMQKIEGSDLFSGTISPQKVGTYPINLTVVDGAKNSVSKTMEIVNVLESGLITDRKSGKYLNEAEVKVYIFDSNSKDWVTWNADFFGQTNPYRTNDDGGYGYILPRGKYYIEVGKKGYKKARSEIFELEKNSVISFNFALNPLKVINFYNFTFHIPNILPPDSFSVDFSKQNEIENNQESSILGKELTKIQIDKNRFADLSIYKGKPLILTYLSSWSPQSMDLMAKLQELKEANPDTQIVTIFSQENSSYITSLFKRGLYSFDYIVDKNGYSLKDLGVINLPKTYFVNKDGVITKELSGNIDF